MKPNENNFPQARILVIDDNAENVRLVARFLEWAGYLDVEVITDPEVALATIRQTCPDIILLDLHMPKLSGYEILRLLREDESAWCSVPVLVFTADQTAEAKARALECGASDFLTKPGDAQEILLRVKNFLRLRQMHLELERNNTDLTDRVRVRTAELSVARREALETLARAAEFRDDETGQHTKRVGELSASIARELGLSQDEVDTIRLAAPLHDVGKIALPDSILLKPAKLVGEEIATMRRHTDVAEVVFAGMESPLMRLARDIAVSHHERWDGTGYPKGLSQEAIPLAARIVAVADVYDALVHERPYKHAWPHAEAVAEIASQKGKQFDPQVVEAFLKLMADGAFRYAA